MMKQRRDSLEIFEKQGRQDLAIKEKEEMQIIEKFLPKQLSEAEIIETVRICCRYGESDGRGIQTTGRKSRWKNNQRHCKGIIGVTV